MWVGHRSYGDTPGLAATAGADDVDATSRAVAHGNVGWSGRPLDASVRARDNVERMTRLELATSTVGRASRSARQAAVTDVERMTRLELATSTLGRSRSTN